MSRAQTLEQSEHGNFIVNTLEAPNASTTYKGVIIKLGKNDDAAVCFDTELLRFSAGWLKQDAPAPAPPPKKGEKPKVVKAEPLVGWRALIDPRNSTSFTAHHGGPPIVVGTILVGTNQMPGWGGGAEGNDLSDPRTPAEISKQKLGPLPKDWAHWKGLYRNGEQVVLSYTVGSTPVMETPGLIGEGKNVAFTRTFHVGASSKPMEMVAFDAPNASGSDVHDTVATVHAKRGSSEVDTLAGLVKAPQGAAWEVKEGRAMLKLAPHEAPVIFRLVTWSGPKEQAAKFDDVLKTAAGELVDPESLAKGGPAQWGQPIETQGKLASEKSESPFVVDTITAPENNPYHALVRFGGMDFFSDGHRAALSTIGGDVWIVSGIDEKLDHLKWQRFATGLFQPLGLKIVKDEVYTVGRDQITHLKDLNGDGEADFYENFNNDAEVTTNYHEFCLDLQADQEGNFYYGKGSPWPPNVQSDHQGTMLKVSKDGSKMEVFATGLRAPNGSAMSEDGQLVCSDNQGHWMPASKVNYINHDGFYGMVPAAHKPGNAQPTEFDKPILWLPMNMDNSSGGEAFVPKNDDKWGGGALNGHLVHLSYGMSSLFQVMTENVDGVTQAAAVRFPLKFESSLMRARFNTVDGQLYLTGLKGWQTNAGREGAFHRVRYTGKPVTMPVEWHAVKNGIVLGFAVPLDKAAATDTGNWAIEQWNYKWTHDYGSPDFSAQEPGKQVKQHDTVDVKSVMLLPDGKSLLVETKNLAAPCDQIKISMKIKDASGHAMDWEVYGTIYKLGAEHKAVAGVQ